MIIQGSSEIGKVYLGNTEVDKIYLGSDLVYGGSFTIPYITDGLVFYVDGINKGSSDGSWKDLIGGITFTNANVTSTSKGWSFNGTSSGFRSTTVLEGGSDFTVEVCFKSTTLPNPFCIFSSGGSTQYNLLFYRSNNYITFLQRSNTYTIPLTVNQGYSISLNLDGGLVNGSEKAKNSGTDYWGNSYFYIGRNYSGRYYEGEIYAIRIYNRRLSSTEQQENFATDNERFELGFTI